LHPQCLLKGLEKEHIIEMNKEEVKQYYTEAISLAQRFGLILNLKHLDVNYTECTTPWSNPYIDVYGNIYPCCIMGTIKDKAIEYFKDTSINLDMSNMIMGNIEKDNFGDVWLNKKYNDFRNECKKNFDEQNKMMKDSTFKLEDYLQLRKCNSNCKNYCKVCGLRFGMVC